MMDTTTITAEMLALAIARAREHKMTPAEREAQRISFVWGQDLEGTSTKEEVQRNLGLC